MCPPQVCYSCLALLEPTATPLASPLSGHRFCSEACLTSSEARFHAIESLGHGLTSDRLTSSGGDSGDGPASSRSTAAAGLHDRQADLLSAFEASCRANVERFPLMAARLAFTRLTRAITGHSQGREGRTPPASVTSLRTAGAEAGSAASTSAQPFQGDPVSDLGFLCFANVSKPYPEPWVQLYGLLRQALEAAVRAAEEQLLVLPTHSLLQPGVSDVAERAQQEAAAASAAALRAELELLDLDWFVSVLSRLHINVFRVGCMLPPPSSSPVFDGRPSAASPAAGNVLWPAMGATTSGSAAYLAASLFNHSCEPNVEVVFRRNDSTATFVASRDIDEVGEGPRGDRFPCDLSPAKPRGLGPPHSGPGGLGMPVTSCHSCAGTPGRAAVCVLLAGSHLSGSHSCAGGAAVCVLPGREHGAAAPAGAPALLLWLQVWVPAVCRRGAG